MTILTELSEKQTALLPPNFSVDCPQCITAYEGSDVTLTLNITSGKPTEISWTRGEQELIGERYRITENNNTVHLDLQNVTKNDVGHYTIIAKNAAGQARRTVELKVEDTGEDVPHYVRRLTDLAVKVGTRTRFLVEIRCASEVKVTWHRNERLVEENERFHLLHEGNFYCVDVAPVMVEDEGRWSCMAESPGGRSFCFCNLTVLVPKAYKSPEFVEELQALLTEQGTVSLECKVIGVPTPVLHWYKDGKEIKAGDVFALTANPDDPTSLGTYTCEAVNCMGKNYSSSRVHVVGKGSREGSLKPADNLKPAGPPPIFCQELRNEKVKIGDAVTLACQVAVPPWPKSISWYNKEGKIEECEKYHIMADGLGGYMLHINCTDISDEGEWKCVASSFQGVKGISSCNVSLAYPKNYRKPRFLESLKAILTEEGLVSFECKVVGFPTPQLRWFKDGQELKPGDVYQLTGTNSLGTYSCIAKNCMGEAQSTAELTVEDIQNQLNEEEKMQLFANNQPPKFIQGLKSGEAKINEQYRFSIQVSVVPESQVSWYRDDENLDDPERYHPSKEHLGVYHLDIRRVEIIDQAEWKCVATNDFGHSVTSCFLKLSIPRHYKKPRFLECLRAILSEEGAVNLECKVIGVPQPVLKWYKDGEELKPGDIHRIISGMDGTCCLGTYTCEAHNCMGTATSSASLLGFEDRVFGKSLPQKVDHSILGGHNIVKNPSLSTIHEERTSQMYDTPLSEHSITGDEKAEISFSFDGKEVSVSLYETPDLTEEEAVQVVEMYADELSEHVSEHNVIELPPLRFMKETSNTQNLLMEAVVIDVTPEYIASVEDDLRTDVDLEDMSITDENGLQSRMLSADIDDDGIIYDKFNTELQQSNSSKHSDDISPPKRPPRKKAEIKREISTDRGKQDSDSYYSFSPSKDDKKSPKSDNEKSDNFIDAVGSPSEGDTGSQADDSFFSAHGSSGNKASKKDTLYAYQVAAIEEDQVIYSTVNKKFTSKNSQISKPGKEVQDTISDAGQKEVEKPCDNTSKEREISKKEVEKDTTNIDNSDASNKQISASLEYIEEKQEKPNKYQTSGTEHAVDKNKEIYQQSIEVKNYSDFDKDPSTERDNSYSEEGDGLKTIIKQKGAEKKKGKDSPSKKLTKSLDSNSKNDEKVHESSNLLVNRDTEANKEHTAQSLPIVIANKDLPSLDNVQLENINDFDTENKNESFIESLTNSLLEIQQGLLSVGKQILVQSNNESGAPEPSLSVLESLAQPIQDSLAFVEEQSVVALQSADISKHVSEIALLENIAQPIEEFHKGLSLLEQQLKYEGREESLLQKTNASILETVSHSLQELEKDIANMQKHAEVVHINDTFQTESKKMLNDSIDSSSTMIYSLVEAADKTLSILTELKNESVHESSVGILPQAPGTAILAKIDESLATLHGKISNAKELLDKCATIPLNKQLEQTVLAVFKQESLINEYESVIRQQAAMESSGCMTPLMTKFLMVKQLEEPVQEICNILSGFEHGNKPEQLFHAVPYRDPAVPSEDLLISVNEIEKQANIMQAIDTLSKTLCLSSAVEKKISALKALAAPLMNFHDALLNVAGIATTEIKERLSNAAGNIGSTNILYSTLADLHSKLSQIEDIVKGSGEFSESMISKILPTLVTPLQQLREAIADTERKNLENPCDSRYEREIDNIDLRHVKQSLTELSDCLEKVETQISVQYEQSQMIKEESGKIVNEISNFIGKLEDINALEFHLRLNSDIIIKQIHAVLHNIDPPLRELKSNLISTMDNILSNRIIEQPQEQSEYLVSLTQVLGRLQAVLSNTEQTLASTSTDEGSVNEILYNIHKIEENISKINSIEEKSCHMYLTSLQSLSPQFTRLFASISSFITERESIVSFQTIEVVEETLQRVNKLENALENMQDFSMHVLEDDIIFTLKDLIQPLHAVRTELLQAENTDIYSVINITKLDNVSCVKNFNHELEIFERVVIELDELIQNYHNIPNISERKNSSIMLLIQSTNNLILDINYIYENCLTVNNVCVALKKLADILETLKQMLVITESQQQVHSSKDIVNEHLCVLQNIQESVKTFQGKIENMKLSDATIISKTQESKYYTSMLPLVKNLQEVCDSIEYINKLSPDTQTACLEYIFNKSQVQNFYDLVGDILLTVKETEECHEEEILREKLISHLENVVVSLDIILFGYSTVNENYPEHKFFNTLKQLKEKSVDVIKIIRSLNKEREKVKEKVTVCAKESAIKEFLEAAQQLGTKFNLIEQQAQLTPDEEPMSERESILILESLLSPLSKLSSAVYNIETSISDEIKDKKYNEEVKQDILLPVRLHINELKLGIESIQKEMATVSPSNPLPDSVILLVENLAEPMQELRSRLSLVEREVVLSPTEQHVPQFSDSISTNSLEDVINKELMQDAETAEIMSEELKVIDSNYMTIKSLSQEISKNSYIEERAKEISEQENEEKAIKTFESKDIFKPLDNLIKNLKNFQLQTATKTEVPSVMVDECVKDIIHSINELQSAIESMELEALVEEKEMLISEQFNIQSFKTLIEPLKELKAKVTDLQTVTELETADPHKDSIKDLSHTEALAKPVEEFQKLVATALKINVLQSLEETYAQSLSLQTPDLPISEFQKAEIHENILSDLEVGGTGTEINLTLCDVIKPLNKLMQEFKEIQQTKSDSKDVSIQLTTDNVKAITKTIEELKMKISLAEQQTVTKEKEDSLSEQIDVSALKTLTKPLEELKGSVMLVQKKTLQETASMTESNIEDTVLLQTCMKQIEELQKQIPTVFKNKILDAAEELGFKTVNVSKSDILVEPSNALKEKEALAEPETMEKHMIKETEIAENLLLKDLVAPMDTLLYCFAEIQKQSLETSPMLDHTVTESVEAIVQPVTDLLKKIALMEQHTSSEEQVQSLSQQIDILKLKSLMQPLEKLFVAVTNTEHSFEAEILGAIDCETKNFPLLQTVAEPIDMLQKMIPTILTTQVLEAIGEEESGILRNLKSKALTELTPEFQEELISSEKRIFEESTLNSVSISENLSLAELIKPLKVLINNFSEIRENYLEKTEALPVSTISTITEVIQPLEDLQIKLCLIEQETLTEEKEKSLSQYIDISALKTLAKPLEELNMSVVQALSQTKLETISSVMNEQSMLLQQAIAERIEKVQKHISLILKTEVLEALEESHSETLNISDLETLAEYVTEPEKPVAVIEQISLENDLSPTSLTETLTPADIVKPLEILIENISHIQQQDLDFGEAQRFSTIECVKAMIQPIKELQHKIALMEEQVFTEEKEVSLSREFDISALKTVAKPLEELRQGIIEIQRQIPLETLTMQLNENICLSSAVAIKQPIDELANILPMVLKAAVFEDAETLPSESLEISSIQTFGEQVSELQFGVAHLQQQVVDIQDSKPTSSLDKLATADIMKPLEVLKYYLEKIQESSLESVEVLSQSNGEFINAMMQPIEELQANIALMQKEIIIQDIEEADSKNINISLLQSLNEPLKELKESIIQISSQISLESHGELHNSKNTLIEQAIIKPIEELHKLIPSLIKTESVNVVEDVHTEPLSVCSLETFSECVSVPQEEMHAALQQAVEDDELKSVTKELTSTDIVKPLNLIMHLISEIQKTSAQSNEETALNSVEFITDMIDPIKELQMKVACIEQQIFLEEEQTFSQSIDLSALKTLAAPLQSLREGITEIQNQVLLNVQDRDVHKETNISTMHAVARSIKELHNIIPVVLKTEILEALEESLSETLNISSLQTFAEPVLQPHKELAVKGEEAVFEQEERVSISDKLSSTNLLETFNSLLHQIAEIQEQAVLEANEGISQSTVESVKAMVKPVEELQLKLAIIEEKYPEDKENTLSENIDLSALKTLAKPLEELQAIISEVQSHVVLETLDVFESENQDLSILKELAKPMLEIQKLLPAVLKTELLEVVEDVLSDTLSISSLQTFAEPVVELQKQMVTSETLTIHEHERQSSDSDLNASGLVKPLKMLVHHLAEVQQAGLESDVVLSASTAECLKVIIQPIEELRTKIALIEQQIVAEEKEDLLSQNSDMSVLKTLAEPLRELRLNVAQIQSQILLDTFDSDKNEREGISFQQAIAKPIDELQKIIPTILKTEAFESLERPPSATLSISSLETFAESIMEPDKAKIEVEEQIVLQCDIKSLNIPQDLEFTDIAKPLEKLVHQLANIQQCHTSGTLILSKDLAAESMKAVIQPIEELQTKIAYVEQQMFAEGKQESLLQGIDISGLKLLSEPLEELKREIIESQNATALETDEKCVNRNEIPTLQQNIAKHSEALQKLVPKVFTADVREIVKIVSPDFIKSPNIEECASKISGSLSNSETVKETIHQHDLDSAISSGISAIENLNNPIQELLCNCVKIQQAAEKPNTFTECVEMLIQPTEELCNKITLIKEQISTKETQMSLLQQIDASILNTLAKSLEPLRVCIAQINSEIELETLYDDKTMKQYASISETVTKPIEVLQRLIPEVLESEVFKAIMQAPSEKSQISNYSLLESPSETENVQVITKRDHDLPPMTIDETLTPSYIVEHLNSLKENLTSIKQEANFGTCEVLSNITANSLKDIIQPIENLQLKILLVQSGKLAKDNMSKDLNFTVLPKLVTHLEELKAMIGELQIPEEITSYDMSSQNSSSLEKGIVECIEIIKEILLEPVSHPPYISPVSQESKKIFTDIKEEESVLDQKQDSLIENVNAVGLMIVNMSSESQIMNDTPTFESNVESFENGKKDINEMFLQPQEYINTSVIRCQQDIVLESGELMPMTLLPNTENSSTVFHDVQMNLPVIEEQILLHGTEKTVTGTGSSPNPEYLIKIIEGPYLGVSEVDSPTVLESHTAGIKEMSDINNIIEVALSTHEIQKALPTLSQEYVFDTMEDKSLEESYPTSTHALSDIVSESDKYSAVLEKNIILECSDSSTDITKSPHQNTETKEFKEKIPDKTSLESGEKLAVSIAEENDKENHPKSGNIDDRDGSSVTVTDGSSVVAANDSNVKDIQNEIGNSSEDKSVSDKEKNKSVSEDKLISNEDDVSRKKKVQGKSKAENKTPNEEKYEMQNEALSIKQVLENEKVEDLLLLKDNAMEITDSQSKQNKSKSTVENEKKIEIDAIERDKTVIAETILKEATLDTEAEKGEITSVKSDVIVIENKKIVSQKETDKSEARHEKKKSIKSKGKSALKDNNLEKEVKVKDEKEETPSEIKRIVDANYAVLDSKMESKIMSEYKDFDSESVNKIKFDSSQDNIDEIKSHIPEKSVLDSKLKKSESVPNQWNVQKCTVKETVFNSASESSDTLTTTSTTSTLTPDKVRYRARNYEIEDSSLASIEDIPTDKSVYRHRSQIGQKDVRKKPTFTTRLTDRTAVQGSRIKLTATILGHTDCSIEWLRDGLPLFLSASDTLSGRFHTSNEDGLVSLEILNASTSDSAEYTCVARNTHGEVSSTACLKVYSGFEPAPFPPTFTRAIKDIYRHSDDELILECRVRSHPPPKITWLKNGVEIKSSNRHQQSELNDGVCRLVISNPDETIDSGQYTCRAENLLWSDQISKAVRFTGREQYTSRRSSRGGISRSSRISKVPLFTSVLTDHLVPSGGTVALQVEIKSTPKPEIMWLRGSDPVNVDGCRTKTFEESGVYTLSVSGITESDAGIYTCRAWNAYGHVDTAGAVEVVPPGSMRNGRPAMFVSRPDLDMSVTVGEDITISFRVTGDPKPKVIWMKGIRDITNSQRALKETLDDYVRLTLKRATVSDGGTYCILAKNVYGCDRSFVTVHIRQRARSLTPAPGWASMETVDILRDVRSQVERDRMKDVPGPVAGEPVVVDSGRNWLTLSWPKGEHKGGAPVLAYKVEAWILGGDGGARWTELGISPINSYDAFNLKPECEYKFRVTPRNRYGWGESVTTTVPIVVGRRTQLPEFTKILPGQLKALRGSTICLDCQVKGDPLPDVRWYKDGIDLEKDQTSRFSTTFDGSNCQLCIKELGDEDSGRYMCEASNKTGRSSTFARLMVVSDPKIWEADAKLKRGIRGEDDVTETETPPQFTMRLRDRRVQMTYPVRLTCQVIGNPKPEVIWSKDDIELKQDDRHSFWNEEHFYTMELSRANLEDSGCYSATAKNPHGSVSCRCNLVVDKGIRAYVAPEFICDLDNEYIVREGGELRLAAQVEAYPTVGVMWHRDGVRLRPSRRAIMTLDHDGRVELALAGVTPRDAGLYSCTATNEVGRTETSTRVLIRATSTVPANKQPQVIIPEIPYSKPPLFITKPRSTEAVEGDTVIIHCEVVGDPKPEVMWLRDWLKPDYYRDAPHFRRVGDGSEYRLEIPQAKLDYTGAYSVIARNCHGEAKAIISLQIYAKGQGKEDAMDHTSVKYGRVQTLPVVKRELKDIRCCDGDAVTLECRVQATPTPDVRWEKDGRLVPLGGDFTSEFNGDTARLSIRQVYPEDEGEYTCVVYNDLGRAATSACLVVDVPEEKETLLSRQLSRPPGLLSAGSTPRSTPRTTPSRSKSPSICGLRDRENDVTSGRYSEPRPRRLKLAAPKFYAVPHNRVAEEGETVRFQCAIAGHPTPWVTWDKDGLLVTPSTRLTLSEKDDLRVLEISEVTHEDAGFYRVTIENEVGRVEASARLEVIGHRGSRSRGIRAWSASPRSSPSFGRRLMGSTARLGGRITLACDIRGSPSPSPFWYRNGELVIRSSRVTPTWDGHTARLEIDNLELEDSGTYTCVAENEIGKTKCSATLKVLDSDDPSDEDRQPPSFLQNFPENLTAIEGLPVELQVRLTGTAPLDVVWSKDDIELPDCEDFRYVDYGDGRVGLRLADVFPQDAGLYRCEAFNDYGDATCSSRLTVQEGSISCSNTERRRISEGPKLQFTKQPNSVLVRPGEAAAFCVRYERDPTGNISDRSLAVTWTVSGTPATECQRFRVDEEDDVSILYVNPVEECDVGQVTCTVREVTKTPDGAVMCETSVTCSADLGVLPSDDRDWVGSDLLKSWSECLDLDCSKIDVESEEWTPAMLLAGPCDTTALVGDRVMLKATYIGNPMPDVRWLKAGHEIVPNDRIDISSVDGMTCLTMDDITADDSGKYVVSIENIHGADCHYASLAVEGPPEPPAGRPSVSSFGNSVVVTWSSPTYDGGCCVTGYCLEMRHECEQDWHVVTDKCHSLSHTIKDLTPGQSYVFRICSENIHGCGRAGIESEPFLFINEEEDFIPAFEPRIVTVEPGDVFKEYYEVLEELGKGRYGVVHKVCDRRSNQTFAAKFVRCIKSRDRECVQDEIDIMNCLRHPKLLQLAAAYDTPREIIMVTEYISGGELFERVVADDFTLTERDCILFMRQICEGVSYMHEQYIVHLDLKPENIMCHTRTSHQVKIIDFGLAQKLDPNVPVRKLFGTPEFIPPEIINYEPIGIESDMWSVGVICYVLLSGLSPFMGDNDAGTFANITRADYDFDDEAFDAISQDAKDFISALLVKRKEKRLTAKECLEHTWLAQHQDTMSCVKLSTDKLKKFIIRRKWQLISVQRRTG